MLPNYAFFKGRVVPYKDANVGVLTHALNYGSAVFGGLRAYWTEEEQQLFIFRPHDHFTRFLQSAKLMCMELPYSVDQLVEALTELMRKEGHKEDCYIRPLAFSADEIIGVRLHNLHTEVSIIALPFGRYGTNEDGQHVTVSSWRRVDDNIIPARGKIAGAYVNSAFIKTDANRAGFDEALVLNQDGHISEGSAANVFVLRNGVWATPPVTDNILEGITRRSIIRFMREDLKWDVVERSIDRTEVYLADEMFFAGTGVQIAAITKVDHRNVGTGKMGPQTGELKKFFMDVVHGRNAKYRDWCYPIYEKAAGPSARHQDSVSVKLFSLLKGWSMTAPFWRIVKATVHRTLAVCLLASICASAIASPAIQQDPDAAEKIRRQVEGFKQQDRLKVKLNDSSEKTGCLRSTNSDGFVIGSVPDARSEKILYKDVAAIRKDKRGPLKNVLRAIPGAALVAGAVFGFMKIGSNTPKTLAVKIPAASGVALIGAQSMAVQACS